MVLTSLSDGAETTTFLAPAFKCFSAPSLFVKNPVDSTTKSIPNWPHGKFSGSLSAKTLISFPFTTIAPSFADTSAFNWPKAVSNFNKWANVLASVKSFTATTSKFEFDSNNLRKNNLPILPKPLLLLFSFNTFLI